MALDRHFQQRWQEHVSKQWKPMGFESRKRKPKEPKEVRVPTLVDEFFQDITLSDWYPSYSYDTFDSVKAYSYLFEVLLNQKTPSYYNKYEGLLVFIEGVYYRMSNQPDNRHLIAVPVDMWE